ARAAAAERIPAGEKSAAGGTATVAAKTATKSSKGAGGVGVAEMKTKKARLLQLCLTAESWAKSHDIATAERELADAKDEWEDVGRVPGDESLRKRFTRVFEQFAQRQ